MAQPHTLVARRRKARNPIYNKIVKMIDNYIWYELDDYVRFINLPAKKLIKISEIVPRENLEDRQNEAPRLVDFVEIAKKFPRTKFEGYLILGRDDERITIDGIRVHKKDIKPVLEILKLTALNEADEIHRLGTGLRLWWD